MPSGDDASHQTTDGPPAAGPGGSEAQSPQEGSAASHATSGPGAEPAPATPALQEIEGPLRSPRAWMVFIATILVGLTTDLASKHLAFRHVGERPVELTRADVLTAMEFGPEGLRVLIGDEVPRTTIVPRLLDFTLVLNPGAVFGLGAGQRWFFVGFTIIAMAFALWMFLAWTDRRSWVTHAGIGLLVSGGLGNLYDRVVYACVRDFIHPLPGMKLPVGRWPNGSDEVWPYVSNVADLYLIIGIGILLIYAWRKPTHEPIVPTPATEQTTPPAGAAADGASHGADRS